MTEFVSLHNQTVYSILDSTIQVKDLFAKVKELGQPAVAITDHGSIASAWDALKASKSSGVKLIIGCEFYFVDDHKDIPERYRHIVLLAKNQVGYKNLLTMSKLSFDQGNYTSKRVYPLLDWSLMEKYSEGIICLTACGNGIVNQLIMNRKLDEAEETILRLKNIFGDNLGLEIQPNNMKRFANHQSGEIDQQILNRKMIDFGTKHNIKVVAACNAHYLNKEDHDMHDTLLAIGSHQPKHSNFRLKYPVPEFYLKTGDEVKKFFSRNYGEEKAKEFCENSIYFANMCEFPDWIDPKFSNPSGKELPSFPVHNEDCYEDFIKWRKLQDFDLSEDKAYLRYQCIIELDKRFKDRGEETYNLYRDRLYEELDVIEYHGFSSYMLIVADYISWARKNNISVGEGRGSVGGSLIGYLINIHQADPIKYNLVFARFHNKEKSSFPDIDTDFAPSGRSKIIDYLREKYGDDHVAHVSNVNKMTPKVYVKDVSRACELGGSRDSAIVVGNDLADRIPAEYSTIDSAIEGLPVFAEYAKAYPDIQKYKDICGTIRAWATHAAGLVISNRPLTGLVPLRRDKDGVLALEYDKVAAEDNGLVKMDILGLSTLDIIDESIRLIEKDGNIVPNISYEDYDQKAYDLISSGNTFCVFQLGTSGGTIELCKKIKPKNINDISNVNALARPSAKDMRPDFISAHNGSSIVKYSHPNLEKALKDTYGYGLYEECLMYIAQDIAGWNLHAADRLRKMTKDKGKNPLLAKNLEKEFIESSILNNIPEDIAKSIWFDNILSFQGYGFNKTHSVLYSMLSYKTAWLKAHYPVHFLLANLMAEVRSNAPTSPANIQKIKSELRLIGIKVLPPDVNLSGMSYEIDKNNNLITGLSALKYVSEDAVKEIMDKRPFKDFFDFMSRVDSSKVRSNVIQALAGSGALDSFNIPRQMMYLYCSDYRKKLTTWASRNVIGVDEFKYPWPEDSEWPVHEQYALEQFYVGEGFACKPTVAYATFFRGQSMSIGQARLLGPKNRVNNIKLIVREVFEFRVKKEGSKFFGMTMGKVLGEDSRGETVSITVFPDRWEMIQNKLKSYKIKEFEPGIAISISATTNVYEDVFGLILDDVCDMSGHPAVPADLKHRKVNLRITKSASKQQELKEQKSISDQLKEELEDILYDNDLITLD